MNLLLKKDTIVRTPRGLVRLDGRNGSHRWMWCATPIVDGVVQNNRIRLVDESKIMEVVQQPRFAQAELM